MKENSYFIWLLWAAFGYLVIMPGPSSIIVVVLATAILLLGVLQIGYKIKKLRKLDKERCDVCGRFLKN